MNEKAIARLHQLPYEYITTQDALDELCEALSKASVITVDTEFVRTRTLKPQLGLLQVFDGQRLALIDPVLIQHLGPFCEILRDTSIIKVLHSCSEDLEALWYNLGVVPSPLFDTQFAASILNKGASIGYANLVESLFSVALDKGESRTDWIARPLSNKQLEYAAADVTYLMAVYEDLEAELLAKNVYHFVSDESQSLIKKKTQPFPSEYAYLNVSNNWKLQGRALLALRLLAKWRLDKAREEDIAINFVLKESAMYELALKLPKTTAALATIHSIHPKTRRVYGQEIISLVDEAASAQAEAFPAKIKRLIEFSEYKKAASDIRTIAEQASESLDIPLAVITSKKQINQFLKWAWLELDETDLQGLLPDLISGWRREIFVDKLQVLFSEGGPYHALRRI